MLYRLVCTLQSALHESSGQSSLHPCKAVTSIFKTEIRPVLKLQKKLAAANKQKCLLMFLMLYLMEETWYMILNFLFMQENHVYEKSYVSST